MYFKKLLPALMILCMSVSAFSQSHRKDKKSEIFVLSTLHQYHATSKYYSFETLSRIIESLHPDILAVELTPADLASRKEQKTKQEYQKSIFPLIDKHKYLTVALEPSEPDFTRLVSLIRESDKDLSERSPGKADAFSKYVDTLYDYLFKTWDSPLSVNSKCTDALFEVKHNYQNSIYDDRQTKGWEGWNTHFLETIRETAQKYKGKRIVVTVGAEHAYWLRGKLRADRSVRLLEPDDLLGKF